MDLPKIEVPALASEGAMPVLEVPENERASVLVVDDSPSKLASVAAIVAGLGLEVATAKSGREALRQLLERDFALILLDVIMPTMDGYETANLIHSRPRSAYTPIIFVTAEEHTDADRYKGYQYGAVDWIYSPIVPEVLQAKVKVFVNLFYLARIARRQAEALKLQREEILRQNQRLEEASRLKSDFLASMSHELRTPLNAIIGFSELLNDGVLGALTPEQKDSVGDILNSGQHLLALINDILDLSKVEAGQMTLEPENLCIRDLLAGSLSIVKEKALKHRIGLTLEAPAELGVLRADLRKLKQIVFNLLSNAVKFTPDGGKLLLRARRVGREALNLEAPEGWAARTLPLPSGDFAEFLEIAVTDTGIGIEEEDLRRLFQAFLQVDGTFARQYEGTGLGLALVRRLVGLHGGTAGVLSAPGKGSTFIAWLPWREPEAGPPARTEAQPAAPTAANPPDRPPLALIIEDDEKAAHMLQLILETQGFRVARAPDATQGLAMARKERPAVITLDILLPGMGGWETLQNLKSHPDLAAIPVVICSLVADQERGFALGASRVLNKPVSQNLLVETLQSLGLGQRGKKQFTVLAVDDDPRAVALVAKQLRRCGAQVVGAYGGREAIATARQVLPDLVVLDLMMPSVSGFDVVEALKSRPETAGVPILVFTAKDVSDDELKRLNGYVEKVVKKHGFDDKEFLREVRRALGVAK